ncbi:Uncharacterized protein PRO82_001141 [Candidatus Protochlamydia amoebophila]|uniref:HAD family hydrolase n=1 Tax=Candidatus Protochlamydia amoebophila TaxID=362787 RepID=UPI001BC953BF|nr:HAD family phosphatase [Candidatus Protochlamydia amoebophila]MBS4163835.1 Uncharacterized protein [Candidatus Protochlamydia amoebophila]
MLKQVSFYLFILIPCMISQMSQVYSQTITPIKVIAFDFGGVIAKSDRSEVNQFLAKELGITEEEADELQNNLKSYSRNGGIEQEFWDQYTHSKGITLPANWNELFDQVRFKSIKEIPGSIQIVKELHKLGYQTALLSNVRMNQARLKRQLGFYDLFHPVLLSFEIGARKPESQSYQILLDQLQVFPQQLLFIDNKDSNVAAAKSMGMDGIVFINAKQLTEELRKRGINLSIKNFNSLSTDSAVTK